MTKCPECFSMGKHAPGCSRRPKVDLDDPKNRELIEAVKAATKNLRAAGIDFHRRGGISRFYVED